MYHLWLKWGHVDFFSNFLETSSWRLERKPQNQSLQNWLMIAKRLEKMINLKLRKKYLFP